MTDKLTRQQRRRLQRDLAKVSPPPPSSALSPGSRRYTRLLAQLAAALERMRQRRREWLRDMTRRG